MDIVRYNQLFPHLIPHLPGLDGTGGEALMLQAIRTVAREFCRRTEAWREELDPIDIEDGTVAYTLDPVYSAEIVRIVEVRINTESGVDEGTEGALVDPLLYRFQPRTNVLTLADCLEPGDDVTDGLDVEVALVPKFGADEIAEDFYALWAETLVAAAIASMKGIAGKPWTDPKGEEKYHNHYRRGLCRALREKDQEGRPEGIGITA